MWITDFGLARIETDAAMTATGDVLGTLRYMCPEQALGKHRIVDERADVYSLGATLYELLTLRPVFAGDDRQELLDAIAHQEPMAPRRMNRAVPAELETIVLKAIEKRPEDRYASARLLADDLQRLLDNKPIRARRPTALERVTKWSRRHKPLVRFAVALVLLATVGLAASTLFIAREKGLTAGALATAEDALTTAQSERENARVAADRAQAMSREARRAVDKMYLEVAQRWLRDQPHMTAVQEEFLRNALEFYQRFAKNDAEEGGRDPSVRWKTAQAHKRVGDIQHRLGRYVEAEAAYRQAITLVERLQADRVLPTDVRLRSELVEAFAARSRVLLDLGRAPEAVVAAREAIAFCDVVKNPGPILPEVTADAHAALSTGQAALGHYAEAESAARRAIELSEPQSKSQPNEAGKGGDSAAPRRRWAERHTQLALLLDVQHRHAEALPLHQQSREMLDRLHDQRTGDDVALDYARATSLRGLAENRFEAGDVTAAVKGFRQAEELFRELADRWADVPGYRLARLENLRRMAAMHFHSNRFREAESVLNVARGGFDDLVDRWPQGARHRGALAACYLQLGQSAATLGRNQNAARDYRSAVAIYEKLAGSSPDVPAHRQRLAEALRGLGFVQHKLAQPSAAETPYRRAISLRDELAATDSDDLVHRRAAIEVRVLLGEALADSRRDKAAEALLRQAVADAQRLADEHPKLSNLRGDLSIGLAALAAFLSQRDGLTEAVQLYRRAITLGEEMTTVHGQYRQDRFMLAGNCHNLALALRRQGRHDETAAPLTRAVRLAGELAGDFPEVPTYANVYAASLNELALLHRQADKTDEAAEALRRALDMQEKLVEQFPEVARYRTTLANVLTNQSVELNAAGDFTAAQQAHRKAIEVLETLVVDGRDGEGRGGTDSRRLLAHNLAMLAWCYCGGPDAEADDPQQALRLAQRAVKFNGDDAWSRQVLGMALCRTGDWAGGLRELQTSMKHDNGGDGWQWMFVSMAHARLGHPDEARQWYDRALAWAEQDPNRNKNQAFRRYRKEAEEAQK